MESDIKDLIETIPPTERGVCVEVRSMNGENTEYFAAAFGKVICIDPWDQNEKQFDRFRSAMYKHRHVYWYRERVPFGAKYIKDKSADLIFINGTQIDDTIAVWLPKVATGGYIGGSSYGCRCVIDVLHKYFPQHFVYQFDDNSWLIKV